jgi:hypothetical protein
LLQKKESNVIKRNDIILVGIIVIIGLALIFIINATKTEGSRVLITVDGKEYAKLPLNKDTTFTIKQDNGDVNILTIKNGQVDMIDANCPDKICVKHADIHYNNETIVCLPHKVVLQIIDGEENETDAVAQ